MTVRFEVKGIEIFRRMLEELKQAGLNPHNAYDLVGQRMVAQQKRHFIKQEGPTGTAWKELKRETIARRRGGRAATTAGGRLGMAGAGRGVKILRNTGTMYRSITYNVDASGVEAGTSDIVKDYAATHQHGDPKRNIPARPFIYINKKEALQLLNTFKKEVLRILEN